VQRLVPDKTEAQCRVIIHAWLKSGSSTQSRYP
jgi:hypothetical protein